MNFVTWIIFGLFAFFALFFYAFSRGSWNQVSDQEGGNKTWLDYTGENNTETLKFIRKIDGFQILVSDFLRDIQPCYRVILKFSVIGTDFFHIQKEDLLRPLKQGMGIHDLEIGDDAFDRACRIDGSAVFLRVLLSAPVREKILYLQRISSELDISNDKITVIIPQDTIDTKGKMNTLIQDLVQTAKNLSRSQDMHQKSIDNALHDPCPRVRVNNLSILHSRYLHLPQTLQVIESAMGDEDSDVRIFAALLAGEKGLPVLKDQLAAQPVSTQNLQTICSHFLEQNYSDGINSLLIYYELFAGEDSKVILLNTLARMGNESLEDFLLHNLSAEKSVSILLALTEALGSCGTLNAVAPLYDRKKSARNAEWKYALQKAIASIQERSGTKGGKGWLSLSQSSDQEGGLSLPEGEQGGLSMTQED